MSGRRAELDADGLYTRAGSAYLVCPELLKHDERHGLPGEAHAPEWRDPEHPEFLTAPPGHGVTLFAYVAGSRPPTPEEWPRCPCGAYLVWTAGDPI